MCIYIYIYMLYTHSKKYVISANHALSCNIVEPSIIWHTTIVSYTICRRAIHPVLTLRSFVV